MGNRSKQKKTHRGAFGSKHLEMETFRVPSDKLQKGDVVLDTRDVQGEQPSHLVRRAVSVKRPSRKDAPAPVVAAKRSYPEVSTQPDSKPKCANGFFGFTKSVFQRKGA